MDNRERNEIEDKFKWNLDSLYKSIEVWEEDFKMAGELANQLESFKGKIGEKPENLYSVLELSDKLGCLMENLYTYSKMKLDENTKDGKNQAISDRIDSMSVCVDSKIAFITPEIMDIGKDKIEEFIEKDDKLKLYKHLLGELIRQKPHILSESEENIIAQMGELSSSPENIFSMLNNADIVFPKIKDELGEEVQITHGNFIPLLECKDRRVRKDSFKALYETYKSFRNTFATSLSSEVKKNIFYARVRKYDSALHSALDDNNIDISVYNNLIDAVGDKLPLLHKYIDIRKKVLVVDELHMYDLYTPIINDVDMKVDYNEAKDMILNGLKPLGEEYINAVENGLSSNWIDVY